MALLLFIVGFLSIFGQHNFNRYPFEDVIVCAFVRINEAFRDFMISFIFVRSFVLRSKE